MKYARFLLSAVIVATILFAAIKSVWAQQQITPSQMAIQIDNAVNGMASSVEVLQAQLKQAQSKVCPQDEPKKPDDAPPK